jgi:hypothetical protein
VLSPDLWKVSIVVACLLVFGWLLGTPVPRALHRESLVFKQQRIVRTTGESGSQDKIGASVTIVYPLAYRGKVAAQDVNSQILKHLRNEFPENEGETIEATIDSFFRAFWENVKKYPDQGWMHHWQVEIEGGVLLQTEDFACLSFVNDNYTGGAHPNQYISFINLSLDNGHFFSVDELVTDRSQLNTIAEAAFRKKRSVPSGESLLDAGFDFKGNKFHLPENVGFNGVGSAKQSIGSSPTSSWARRNRAPWNLMLIRYKGRPWPLYNR